MKKQTIIITVFCLGLSIASCKKVYNNYEPEQKTLAVSGENYSSSEDYIVKNNWRIIAHDSDEKGSYLIWKLRVDNTNNYLIIDKAPPEQFYRADRQPGNPDAVLLGSAVIKLNIKSIK